MSAAIIRALRRVVVSALVMGVFVVAGLQLSTAHAAPGINQQMNFQGRLLTAQGATVPDGYYNMQFKIYQDGTGTAAGNPSGTLKWTESWINQEGHGVQVKNGYMSLQLGSITSLSSVDWNQDTLWLSINVGNTSTTCTPFTSCGGDGEMLPMKRLSSTPYAFNAGKLGGLSAAQFLQLAQGVQTDAGTNTSSIALNKTGTGGNFLNLQANSVDVFTIGSTGDITFGNNIDHSISVTTAAASTAGRSLTISGGTAGTGASALTGGNLVLQGGNGGGTGGNGGNLVLDAGAAAAGGTGGSVIIGGTNASSITLGQNTTVAAGKSVTITGGATGTRPSSPTEGMVYYDTDTKQLLTYSNGKWQADSSTASFIVAASNSSQRAKDSAQYIANGEDSAGSGKGAVDGDQVQINQAIAAAATSGGGTVYLMPGTYTIDEPISVKNNVTLAGAGSTTLVQLGNFGATSVDIQLITNDDQTTGAGIVVRDMILDGRSSINTVGWHVGVHLVNMGSVSGSQRDGARITGLSINNIHNEGINVVGTSSGSLITGNTVYNAYRGIVISGSNQQNTITNNVVKGNTESGIYLTSNTSRNTVSNNSILNNASYGIYAGSATYNTLSENTLSDNGGNSTNNALFFATGASNNSVKGNTITDSAATTNYALNISSGANANYLADNTFASGSINDAGTGTVYANQSRTAAGGQLTNRTANSTEAFAVQNASGSTLFAVDTTNSQVTIGNTSTQGKLTLSDGSSNTATIQVAALAGNYTYTIPTTTANDTFCLVTLNNCAADSTQFIQNQNTAAQTTSRFWIDGTGRADTSLLTPTVDTATSATLNIGTTTANGVTIGRSTTTTTINGNLAVTLNTTTGTTITCRNPSGYLSVCDSSVLTPSAANFIQNGSTLQTAASFWIDGTGKASSGFQSNSIDALAPGNTLSLGTGNAGAVTIGKTTTTTTIQGNIGVTLNATTGTTQVCRNATGLLSSCDATYLAPTATNFIQNQAGTPGTAQTGNFNITGTGIAGTLQAGSLVSPSLDTETATALNIGTTNASAINLNQNVTIAANKSLTLTGGTTANRPASPTEGTLWYDTTTKQLLIYANGKWQADRSTATKIVGTSASGGASSAVASLSPDGADYVNTSATSAQTVINSALSAISSTGGTLYLMEGTYIIDDSISIPNNVTLMGAGSGTVIKLKNGINANINAIIASDTSTGTGVTITNLRIDGNRTNNTSGTQNGIYFSNMGAGNGTTARQGAKLTDLWINNLRNYGITLEDSNNGIVSGNHINNNSFGLYFLNNNNMTITGNSIQGNTRGIYASPINRSVITSNTVESNTNGIMLGGTSFGNTITGNVFNNNGTNGLSLANSTDNEVSGNRFRSNGGATTNEAIVLSTAANNSITDNTITDSSATTTNYAIDISDSASTGNYIADNTLGGGSINDATASGGNTYGGQLSGAGNYLIQPAGTIELQKSTNVTGTLTASTSVLTPSLDRSSAGTLTIGSNATNTTAITIGSSGITTTIQGNTGVTLNTTTGTTQVCRNASGVLSTCDATYLSPTASNFIQNGTSQQASANFNISGTGVATTLQASTSVLTPLVDAVSSATALNIGTTNASVINLNQNVTVAANKSLTLAGGTTANRPSSPTEGTLWYDTTTKQLLIYANGKWQADKSDAVVIAASNSSQTDKDAANYVTDGNTAAANDGDQVQINQALTAGSGKKVILLAGTYIVDATIAIPNNTTLAGVGQGTIIQLADIDTTDDLIENTDQTTGTGITIRDLRVDGQDTLNTGSIVQRGIYLRNMGDYTTARVGATIDNVRIENVRDAGIYLDSSDNATVTNSMLYGMDAGGASVGIYLDGSRNNTFSGNVFSADYWGIRLDSASTAANTITGNTFRGGQRGVFVYAATTNTITGNTFEATTNSAINLYQSNSNVVSGNIFTGNTNYGILLDDASYSTVAGNNFNNSGNTTDNNAIYIQGNSDGSTITGNSINDSSATTTNYAINIAASTSDATYLASNTIGSGTIRDTGTGTIYASQFYNSTNFRIQPATNVTVGNTATTTTIQGSLSITPQTSTSTTLLCSNAGVVSTCDSSVLAPTATNFIRNQNSAQQAGAYFWISGSARADTSVLTPLVDTASAGTLGIGTSTATGITLGKSGVATTAAGGLLAATVDATSGSSLSIGATNATSISIGKSTITTNLTSNTITVGSPSGTTTISGAAQTTNNTAGSDLVIKGSNGLGTGNGGNVTIQGGNGGTTGNYGGNLTLAGGTGTTSNGIVILSTSAFQTATADTACFPSGTESTSTTNCTITQNSVNNNAAVIVGFTNDNQTAFMPDPSITATAGRVVYVTASGATKDFTLSVNGGGTGNQIAMRKNTTATMIWNGADWTAAGASSSTTLQAAYDNTLQSAGGAELVVSKTTATNGLTIRDSSSNSVNGALLTVQSSSAANLFSVNSNVTEYATDAGAEVYGASTTTFPANTWATLASPTSMVARYTTAGDYIATGQGSVSVTTPATTNAGVMNRLTAALSTNMTYNVSFSTRLASGTFTDMTVYYSINGTAQSVVCATGQTAKTSIWTKVNCTFQAPSSGITATNAILIQQASGVARTFYVDNLSVTIAADYNYATDGDVDDSTNFGTNWVTAGLGTVGVTRSTTDGYNASSSATATITAGAANAGLRNKLSINPLTSTLYRVSIYAKATASFTDFKVRYSPDGGTNYVDCVDYNTQTLTTTSWTQVTCYIKTGTTTVSNPYVYFVETASAVRTYSVDAFSMTLASNTAPNVQIGSGSNGGPTTLFTLDKGASAPIAANNDALLGSMYYDTTLGKLQCYEADGWGACGSSPDNIVTISPEYTNAVMHGTGIGTMTSDICSDALDINDPTNGPAICSTNETYNFYKWTSPQATSQAYSIYVTYQLPTTFKEFASGQTSVQARVDNTSNASVQLQVYKNHSGLTPCGGNVTLTTSANTWQAPVASGTADPSTCGFAGGDSVVFKITMSARSNANAYIGNLNFTFSNK